MTGRIFKNGEDSIKTIFSIKHILTIKEYHNIDKIYLLFYVYEN